MNGTPAPRRIGWRAANRILSGQDGGRGTEDLRTLIAIAAAPLAADAAHAQSTAHDAVLTAFRETAAAPQPTGRQAVRQAARSRHTSRALVLQFAAAVLVVCGVGAAAASAGVLPAGMQRIAHDYFGVGSLPAPSTHVPSSNAATSGAPTNGASRPAAPSASGLPASPAVIVALCQKIADDHGNWHADLDAADQATLIAAAGDDHKVKAFCAQLLANAGRTAVPSAKASDTPAAPSVTPSVEPTETHGNAHVSRSPAPHGAGH